MNIYIPKHIKNIPVVSKMCDLINAYNNSGMYYDSNSQDPYNDYYYYLKTDPVARFLHFCLHTTNWEEEHPGEDYESAIYYLSKIFYSSKGTYGLFDLMSRYLGFKIVSVEYNGWRLRLTIDSVTLSDIDEITFFNAFYDFLNALLYFGGCDIDIENINLLISNTLITRIGATLKTYKDFKTIEYQE